MLQLKINLFFIVIFLTGVALGQSQGIPNENVFDSVYSPLDSGQWKGNANGSLFFMNQGKKVLYSTAGEVTLTIVPDEEEIYDSSYKNYEIVAFDGRGHIKYSTYAGANELAIAVDDEWYGKSHIDGACDMVIENLTYEYKNISGTEFLILGVEKPIVLHTNYLYEGDSSKALTLLPNSRIMIMMPVPSN